MKCSRNCRMKTVHIYLQCHYVTDLSRHPQLDIDVGAVRDIYSESAVSVR